MELCPKKCIHMEIDAEGARFSVIREEQCISCQRCRKVCPSLNPPVFHRPAEAYAMWSEDPEVFSASASGGIGTELYRYALERHWYVAGAEMDQTFRAVFTVRKDRQALKAYRNSKYTFSHLDGAVGKIRELLNAGETVLFIGTGCQCAGIRNSTGDIRTGELYLVDLVCHGMPPERYLREHIEAVDRKMGKTAVRCSFRDPDFGTEQFVFSLFDRKGEKIYSRPVLSEDVYQVGYHKALIYRENCYACLYAGEDRCGDLTISDYKGIGTKAPCDFSHGKMSSVLVNTEKGKRLVEGLTEQRRVEAYSRPVEEPIEGDPQLQHPSFPHKKRALFLREYKKGKGFEQAAKKALRWERFLSISHARKIKAWLKRLLGI